MFCSQIVPGKVIWRTPHPLFKGGGDFWKNKKGGSRFSCKNWGSLNRGFVCRMYHFSLISMDFVAVMLFTEQVFYLECLFYFWLLLIVKDCYLRFLLFWIKFQPGVAYKSFVYKKIYDVVFSHLKMKK